MIRRWPCCWLLLALSAGGCFWEDSKPNFGSRNAPIPPREKLPQGSLEAATRVDFLGRQIMAANPDLGVRPMFFSIGGKPGFEVFHHGVTEIYITDSVVGKCTTDAELAAVLCSELGKMVAEARLQGPMRNPAEREPPAAPSVGSDVVGGDRDPDRTRMAERAMWEKKNPRQPNRAAMPPADPNELSRTYLINAGYKADELNKVGPLLRQAESNPDFEKQLTGPRNTGMPSTP